MSEIRSSDNPAAKFVFAALKLDEFIPVVHLDIPNYPSGKLISILTGQKIKLSDNIDASKREIDLLSLVVAPGKLVIPFRVEKGATTFDVNGTLTLKVAQSARDVEFTPKGPAKARIGERFELNLEIKGNTHRRFQVDFLANDDAEESRPGDLKDTHCGSIVFEIFPDVFFEDECGRLIDEINFIKPFADAKSPSEYAGNYCMGAADRGLSKLLENTSDFYSVDRRHQRLNKVAFTGKSAKNRGEAFSKLGFVHSSFEFNAYNIDHALRLATKSDEDYDANLYKVVTIPPGSELDRRLLQSMAGKPGFHVYYFSVCDDYHTLLLTVDNREAGKEYYAIFDQHGMTSSSGPIAELGAGIAKQTSWTFLDFYMATDNKEKRYPKVITRIWKIQRKSP